MGYSVAIYTDQEILGMKKFVHTWLEVSGNEGDKMAMSFYAVSVGIFWFGLSDIEWREADFTVLIES